MYKRQAADSFQISGPEAAKAVLGDFVFLAGKPSEELLLYQPPCKAEKKEEFQILVPRDADWENLIKKVYGSRAERITRYAIQKEPDAWDGKGRERLQEMVSALPEGYELRLIDQELYDQCRQQEWSRDLVSQFPDYETYQKWGSTRSVSSISIWAWGRTISTTGRIISQVCIPAIVCE